MERFFKAMGPEAAKVQAKFGRKLTSGAEGVRGGDRMMLRC